jgi:hypothetical protein
LLAGCTADPHAALHSGPREAPPGLFTSLPILWREAESVGELLGPGLAPHWALAVIERQSRVRPLDSLIPHHGKSALRGIGLLIMAQPRALAPQENVALDKWVRGGGQVLLFADPMLTAQSAFGFGDRRRPEAIAMLSPILARWGLRLEFDSEQQAGLHEVDLLGAALPVNLPGVLVTIGGKTRCALHAGGLAAICRIGRGRAMIVADAALFEEAPAAQAAARRAVLQTLIDAARGGDSRGGK